MYSAQAEFVGIAANSFDGNERRRRNTANCPYAGAVFDGTHNTANSFDGKHGDANPFDGVGMEFDGDETPRIAPHRDGIRRLKRGGILPHRGGVRRRRIRESGSDNIHCLDGFE
jgi:hypothetical protein